MRSICMAQHILRRSAQALLLVFLALMIVTVSGFMSAVYAQPAPSIPRDALQHRAALKREAQRVWGLAAPVATFAAQIHQESRWRPEARSPVGALGLAQFMPATAQWIGSTDAGLAARAPLNPTWAIRALVQYDHWLHQRTRGANACEHMAFVLASYNSGLGTVQKKQRALGCKPDQCLAWFNLVELSPAGQSSANHQETRGYPQRILMQLEPAYVSALWGAGSGCTGAAS